jgi:hypothetical protein
VVASTTDGTAKAGADYTAVSRNVTFNPGDVTKTVAVAILGDTKAEPNESFGLTVNLVSGRARITDGNAVGTITNDD